MFFWNLLREVSAYFREVSAYFRGVRAYFREVSAYFRLETSFQNFKTSFEKFGAIMATGGLQKYLTNGPYSLLESPGTQPIKKRPVESQRRQDDNKNEIFTFWGGGAWGTERKIAPKTLFFHGKRHDNKILKVQILLSKNFVVIAQAPREVLEIPSSSKHFTCNYFCRESANRALAIVF